MSIFVPVTADRVCLSLTARTIIHASAVSPVPATREASGRGGVARTACGSDAFLVAMSIVNRPGDTMAAPWPPRPDDRCTDCMTAIGKTRREATASAWLNQPEVAA